MKKLQGFIPVQNLTERKDILMKTLIRYIKKLVLTVILFQYFAIIRLVMVSDLLDIITILAEILLIVGVWYEQNTKRY